MKKHLLSGWGPGGLYYVPPPAWLAEVSQAMRGVR